METEVKAAQTIATKGIGSALEDYSTGAESLHNLRNNWFEDFLVALIIHAISQGAIHGIELASSSADILQITSSREIFTIFMETDSHDSVSSVESFLHTVTVMDININVENTLVIFEQLQDAHDDIVDITET